MAEYGDGEILTRRPLQIKDLALVKACTPGQTATPMPTLAAQPVNFVVSRGCALFEPDRLHLTARALADNPHRIFLPLYARRRLLI